jgi:hypothetical protein
MGRATLEPQQLERAVRERLERAVRKGLRGRYQEQTRSRERATLQPRYKEEKVFTWSPVETNPAKGRVILKGTPYAYLRALNRSNGQAPPPSVGVLPAKAEPPRPPAPNIDSLLSIFLVKHAPVSSFFRA